MLPSKPPKPWIENLHPSVVPYAQLARLHYFNGPNLFFWCSVLGLILGAGELRLPVSAFIKHIPIHFVASIVLHGVGSTWDDICDRHIDGQVERTKNRPLVVGSASLRGAVAFVFPQAWFLIELLRLSQTITLIIGLAGLFIFVPLYPLMKRITHWPQAWLGITTAINTAVGYTSITGTFNWSTVGVLCVGMTCWCIHYDTVYGAMDIKDDIRIGVKSTAVLFGDHIRAILALFAAAFIISLIITGINVGAPLGYYAFAVVGSSLHLAWQLHTVDFGSNSSCTAIFSSNATSLGYILCLGFLAILRV